VFDLELPAGLAPRNIDGEVAEHRLMPVADALARAAAGELTTDAALATLHDLGEGAAAHTVLVAGVHGLALGSPEVAIL